MLGLFAASAASRGRTLGPLPPASKGTFGWRSMIRPSRIQTMSIAKRMPFIQKVGMPARGYGKYMPESQASESR